MAHKIAIVVFPGSNCERDASHVLGSVLGQEVTYHWHADPIKHDYRAVILPGGFSYGDYLRAGALAKISPAVESLLEYVEAGKPVLGICNGFQILTEAGLLPGALSKNGSLRFQCEDVHVRVDSNSGTLFRTLPVKTVMKLPIAHSEGRYVADAKTLKKLRENKQIALRYCGPLGESLPEFNANGSMDMIAGITNEKGNVLGLMPHPERCSEAILGNSDGLLFFKSMIENI